MNAGIQPVSRGGFEGRRGLDGVRDLHPFKEPHAMPNIPSQNREDRRFPQIFDPDRFKISSENQLKTPIWSIIRAFVFCFFLRYRSLFGLNFGRYREASSRHHHTNSKQFGNWPWYNRMMCDAIHSTDSKSKHHSFWSHNPWQRQSRIVSTLNQTTLFVLILRWKFNNLRLAKIGHKSDPASV